MTSQEVTGLVMTIAMVVGIIGCSGLIFAATALGIFFLFKRISGSQKEAARQRAQFLQTGLAAKATVLKLATQSMRISMRGYGGAQKTSLTLQVHPGPGIPESYTVQISPMIPDMAMPQIQPQAEIRVKVSPTDRDKVMIDFEAMGFSGLENFALDGLKGLGL
jgi:hypothetical protein